MTQILKIQMIILFLRQRWLRKRKSAPATKSRHSRGNHTIFYLCRHGVGHKKEKLDTDTLLSSRRTYQASPPIVATANF